MVQRIFSFFQKEINGVHSAAYLLGGFAFLSQLLALVRDRLLAAYFGPGEMLDLYYAAFRIPDLIFASVASLVSISVLIPFLSGKVEDKQEEVKDFMGSVMSAFLLLMVVVSTIAFFLLPYIAYLLVPRTFSPDDLAQFVLISRILLLQPIALGISNLLGSITQVKNRFFIYASSPLLYNLSIIAGIIGLYPFFGLKGIVMGVVIGSVLHAAVQVPYLLKIGLLPHPALKIKWITMKKVFLVSLPRTLTLSLNSLELIFITAYASLLTAGSISIFNLSLNLQSVPFAIIGVSYSLAAFPTLSKLFSNGEKEKFIEHVTVAARHIIFWSLPVMALFVVLRAQIVRVILGSGNFNWNDTRLTAACLALFVFSLFAQSLELLFVRGYYASGNTKKPLIINVIFSIVTIVLPFVLLQAFSHIPVFRFFIESLFKVDDIEGTAVLMLPLGFSIGTILNVIALWIAFSKDFKIKSPSLVRAFFESSAVSIIIGFITYASLNVFAFFDTTTVWGIFLQGFLAGTIGIVIGGLIFIALKNSEIREIMKLFPRKIWKEKVVLEQDKLQ